MLFDKLTLRGLDFRNRIVVSPMCQYSSEDGFASDWHLVHLGSRAVGGAGLVFTEATAVEPRGRISLQDLGLWKDEHIAKLSEITRFITAQGAQPGIQLAHAGRKGSTPPPWSKDKIISLPQGGWTPVAPSALPFDQDSPIPSVLSLDDIRLIIQAFRDAARRALKAGFKVIEVHAAHGYLLHQFLSPTSNKRPDAYGGTFENRARFPLEVVSAVRAVWPEDLPLFVRISATDWTEPDGWDLPQSIELARRFKSAGVDLIDCSSGALVPQAKIPAGPGFQVPFSTAIRQETGIATGAVGFITSAVQAETILRNKQADMVFLARQFLRDPYWPFRAAADLKENAPWPKQYGRAAA
jgi:2,4-dienoyl-CoA reductase-like NADH-dependent reductase (Old Yellow Enzyme family)